MKIINEISKQKNKTCVNSGKIVISTLVPIIGSACIFCTHSCVFARLDLFPKKLSKNISWGAEWEEWDDGSWGEGVLFFLKKRWPSPRFIGGLDSWDPRKWKGFLLRGTPIRGPQTTGTQMLHVLIIGWIFQFAMYSCGVSSWTASVNCSFEVSNICQAKKLPFFGQVKS